MSGFDEFALISSIRQQARPHPRVLLGIGDDTALLRFPSPADCLLTTDLLIEGVHFTIPSASAEQIGRKALAVNLSDLAAMAGRPLAAVVVVAHSRRYGEQFARDLHRGLQAVADEFDVAVAGGDTNIWDGPLVIGATLLGEPTGKGPVTRSGAVPGDWILTTGRFGGSLSSGRHLTFRPRIEEAVRLHEAADLHAMIDVSDGLAADLCHILDESNVGAELQADAVPIHADALAAADQKSPLEHALSDGEDFELLFTASPEEGRRLLKQPPVEVELTRIGQIVEPGRREIIDSTGKRRPLEPVGWRHEFNAT